MRTFVAVVLFAAALTACTGGDDVADTADPVVEPEFTYYADVQPILKTHCTRCHQDGGVGPFDFTDPEVFGTFADRAIARMRDGTMPPPAADPECHDYIGSEHLTLQGDEADIVQGWLDEGKAMGNPDDAPVIEPIDESMDEVDLEMLMPAKYTPLYQSEKDPGNEYRCFFLDHGSEDGIFIRQLHPVIDNPALVHHVVLFTVDKADVPEHDPNVGVDCIDMSPADGMIAGWAPGMLPVTLPDGAALKVEAGEVLVLQMHYYNDGTGTGQSDQSGYAFDLVDPASVTDNVFMVPVGAFDFNIPAGDGDYTFAASFDLPDLPITGKIYATFPHMHLLGKAYEMNIDRDGERECLVQSDKYDFNNQLTYVFPEPEPLAGGDTVNIECTWDNSTGNPNLFHDPPIDVGYGERTDEEMCYAFTLISIDGF